MDRNKLITDLTRLYNMIVGKKYKVLTPDERRVLYAVELWNDGADPEAVATDLIDKTKSHDLSPEWVDEQLRRTFEYNDDTEVPAL